MATRIEAQTKPDPAAVEDLHAYVRWFVQQERKREAAKVTRARCEKILQLDWLSDEQIVERLQIAMRKHGRG